jgi:F-type H+-transporting ATPase subunit alpha
MEEQVVSVFSCTPREDRDSWVRQFELKDLGRYERELLDHMRGNHGDILKAISDSGKLDDDVEEKLIAALDEFAKIFQPSSGAPQAA